MIDADRIEALPVLYGALTARLAQPRDRPFVLGICGSQASGKSTVVAALASRLREDGYRVATLSLDDLYLSYEARQQLAATVHPLFATRGVPGTHDVALGLSLFDALDKGEALRLPRFDKANDTLRPVAEWPVEPGPVDIFLFEGWCIGARPQAASALDDPVNALEQDRDADGLWRRTANDALAGPYQQLFARIDMLAFLKAPGFDVILRWRTQQEHGLRAQSSGAKIMSDDQIARFIAHYERLTCHMLTGMPDYADIVLHLDVERHVKTVTGAAA